MEHVTKAVLKHTSVRSIHIDIDPEKLEDKETAFESSGKSELRIPKNSNDQTFLLLSQFEIHSRNTDNAFHANIAADFYFETNTHVDDYDDVVRNQCLSIIQKEITALANSFLKSMGYPEFLSIRE